MKLISSVLLATLIAASAWPAAAQETSISSQLKDLQAAVQSMQEQMRQQQRRITALESENKLLKEGVELQHVGAPGNASRAESVQASAAPAGTSIASAASSGTNSLARFGQFTPDIGLVADIVGKLTESDEDTEGNDRFSVRHAELILGHDVDPYSRLDSVIAFSDEHGVEVEEVYLTHFGLPGGTKARFGRFRPKVGAASAVHTEQLDSVDTPFVIAQYLGEEGYFKTGVELSNFIPFPFENPSTEVMIGILEGGIGEEGTMFGSTKRRPTYYARQRTALELGDFSDVALGTGFLLGSADDDSANEVRAFTADLTFNHRFNSINRLKLQAEAIIQDRSAGYLEDEDEEESHAHAFLRDDDEHDTDSLGFRSNPYGLYFLADYRLGETYSVGGRFDLVEPINRAENDEQSAERAYSAWLTLHQSEFARWRFQYQYVDQVDGGDDNRFFLQGTFAIGVHKHQLN